MSAPHPSGDTISGTVGADADQVAVGKDIVQIKNVYQHVRPQPVDETTLAAAQAKLAALPLDVIPAVASLPPGSRLPLSPNPIFVGRDVELRTLARTLHGGMTIAIGSMPTAAATGWGGIGKTQLAVEFAHRYGQYFAGGVFWLSLADAAAVPAEIATCGGPGYLDLRPDYASLKLDDQVALVLAAWQSPLPRLLIFDNCEDPDLIARWRPPSGGCRILVTSRRHTWPRAFNVQTLALAVLPRQESIALLHRFIANDDQSSIINLQSSIFNQIAEELGDLPLALHLAGSFLDTYRHVVTPAAYLAQLRSPALLDHRSLTSGDYSPTGHEQNVARTFALSYDRLDAANAVDALALKVLARAAHFAPGAPIPRGLLLAAAGVDSADGDAAFQAEDAVQRLTALGLTEPAADGTLRLHRLLARFVQQAGGGDDAQSDVEATILSEARQLNQAGFPAPLLAWQSHLRFITDEALQRGDQQAASLCNEAGYHLLAVGDLTGAKPYYEQALAIRRKLLGDTHSDTAQSFNNLGHLLQAQGDLAKARLYLERALALRRSVLGDNHADTARSFNNLGSLLHAQGDLSGARRYLHRALRIRRKVLGDNHSDTAQSLNNLAGLLQDLNDLVGARLYFEQALTIRKAVLGEQHSDTAESLNNLGGILFAQRDLAGAQLCFEQALATWRKQLGDEHPDTALSLNNLGYLLQEQGDLGGAKAYYEQALAIFMTLLGPYHPRTQAMRRNLEALLREMERKAGV